MKRVHITSGEFFNQWLKQKVNEPCIPFNEAMMSQPVLCPVFSGAFIQHRAYSHGVDVKEYIEKMKGFINLLECLDEVDELVLWFGIDAFCQMNLLTILKVLEDFKYTGTVKTVLFDENQPWEKSLSQPEKVCHIQGVSELFQKVLVDRTASKCNDTIMNRAVELFLDYHCETGKLSRIVKSHPELDEYSLMILLLENSKEYGLSDVQAKALIRNARRQENETLFICD